MPKTKEQKKEILKDIKDNVKKQKSIVFVDIKGLKAKDVFDLREALKKADSLLAVAKKTLINIVFKESKIKVNSKKLQGQAALVFGFEDEVSPAKVSYNFSKKNDKLKILGGIFENKFVEAKQVLELAQLPSKKELYAKVVGTINAPVSNFVGVLQGNIRNFVYLLSQIKK